MTNRHDAIQAETRRVLKENGREAAFRYLRDAGVSPMLATLTFGLAAGSPKILTKRRARPDGRYERMKEPPAGVEPAPRPYKGRVLAVDTTEARVETVGVEPTSSSLQARRSAG